MSAIVVNHDYINTIGVRNSSKYYVIYCVTNLAQAARQQKDNARNSTFINNINFKLLKQVVYV